MGREEPSDGDEDRAVGIEWGLDGEAVGDEAEGSAADDEDVGSPAHPERATVRARAVSTPFLPETATTR